MVTVTKPKASPNVVPLCDILLVLLIIFMVIAPMTQEGMDVKIPEVGGSGTETPVVLTIDQDGTLELNKEKIENLAALETRLEFIFSSGNRPLYVKAHEKVLYQDFINAINTAKKAGIQTICAIPQRL